ncbi:hypothetical protein BH20ACT15_BH20ACT15_08850 [soil metagenome]
MLDATIRQSFGDEAERLIATNRDRQGIGSSRPA